MPRIEKNPAEEMLVEHGLLSRRTAAQREILGCIACRWSQEQADPESVGDCYGLQLINCTQLKPGTIYPILRRLEAAGVIAGILEEANPASHGGPPRVLYEPVDTELGRHFQASLQVAVECSLEFED